MLFLTYFYVTIDRIESALCKLPIVMNENGHFSEGKK